ncbi:MAG: hypothetical protein PHE88_04395 [Elusimicrobia bacterium]|nr:hypothetical protein [Elusimicrobiota bacterium]
MLPVVNLCGLKITRLIIGANPFAGFSHKNKERDAEMMAYYTPERICETWDRAYAAGINTMITNNETLRVINTVKEYLKNGGSLQWIGQIANRTHSSMFEAIDEAVAIGAKAIFFHGMIVDDLCEQRDDGTLREWVQHARSHSIPVGVAGHSPATHKWVDSLDLVDFHVVCFFNCASVHAVNKDERWNLSDIFSAVECIRRIRKPCIGYKIMGAGRIDPAMAIEFAFENIKPGDMVNVGIYRGDKDNMVEENADIVRKILEKISKGT